jgi:hypothetical protein
MTSASFSHTSSASFWIWAHPPVAVRFDPAPATGDAEPIPAQPPGSCCWAPAEDRRLRHAVVGPCHDALKVGTPVVLLFDDLGDLMDAHDPPAIAGDDIDVADSRSSIPRRPLSSGRGASDAVVAHVDPEDAVLTRAIIVACPA